MFWRRHSDDATATKFKMTWFFLGFDEEKIKLNQLQLRLDKRKKDERLSVKWQSIVRLFSGNMSRERKKKWKKELKNRLKLKQKKLIKKNKEILLLLLWNDFLINVKQIKTQQIIMFIQNYGRAISRYNGYTFFLFSHRSSNVRVTGQKFKDRKRNKTERVYVLRRCYDFLPIFNENTRNSNKTHFKMNSLIYMYT